MKPRLVRNSYEGVIEDWKVRMIIARAKMKNFGPIEIEDALQVIVPVLMRFKYDPEKENGGGEEAALRVCIDRRLTSLQRFRARHRKKLRRYQVLAENAAEPKDADTSATVALSLDVKEVMAQLSPEERAACEAVTREPSLDEAAESLGTTRYLLQRTLDAVKRRFARAGF